MHTRVTAKNVGDPFLWDTVYIREMLQFSSMGVMYTISIPYNIICANYYSNSIYKKSKTSAGFKHQLMSQFSSWLKNGKKN